MCVILYPYVVRTYELAVIEKVLRTLQNTRILEYSYTNIRLWGHDSILVYDCSKLDSFSIGEAYPTQDY